MYHGTNAEHLPKIFQLGMIPDPTKGHWKGDKAHQDATLGSPSLHSLKGSYWTDNTSTAFSSAIDAVRGSAGRQAVIIAQIVPQTAKADEDDVRNPVLNTFRTVLVPHFGHADARYVAPSLKGAIDADPKFYNKIVDEFAKHLHDRLKTGDKMPMDKAMMKKTFDATLERMLGHIDMTQDRGKWNYIEAYERWLENVIDWEEARVKAKEKAESGDLPKYDKVSGEKKFLDALDDISRRYRKSAMPPGENDPYRLRTNLRVTEPVGFSGRNKIVAIIVGHGRQLELAYGKVPQQFIDDYSKSWGPNFRIIDRKTGKPVYNSLED